MGILTPGFLLPETNYYYLHIKHRGDIKRTVPFLSII
jgi:hypothetical protein